VTDQAPVSLLAASKQVWKLGVVAAASLTGLALLGWDVATQSDSGPAGGLAAPLGGLALAFSSLLWGAVSIQCPVCHQRLLWKAIRERSPTDWLTWLLTLTKCPGCEARGR